MAFMPKCYYPMYNKDTGDDTATKASERLREEDLFHHSLDSTLKSLKYSMQERAEESLLKTFEVTNITIEECIWENNIKVIVFVSFSKSEEIQVYSMFSSFESLIRFNLPYKLSVDITFECDVKESISGAYQELKKAGKVKEENNMKQIPEVKKIIHSGDYTHVIWEDDTKTSVKRAKDSFNDPYSAFAQAVLKKLYGSTEKAKFEHEIKQKSVKEQKKILAEKEARRAKQQKREERKISKELARQEKELEEKKKEVEKCREKKRRIVSRKDNK